MRGLRRILTGLLAALTLAVPGTAGAAAVRLPVEGYYQRQTVNVFGTLVDAAFLRAHRDLWPLNGYRNQFTGYHAAEDVDFHDPGDLDRTIPVRAVADGTVIYAGTVAGYGGLIIVRHAQPEAVTSLYGHVRLDGAVTVGDRVRAGERLADLGDQFSADTSGARKHLHFAIHKGTDAYLQGYEPTTARLDAEWYNPNDWLARYGAGPTAAPVATATSAPSATPVPHPAARPKSLLDRLVDFLKDLFS